jgi:hypothetical protein
MSQEKGQYLNITPDSIGRFTFAKSPPHLKGLCTAHQPSSIVIIIHGKEGISMVHSTGKISSSIILTEFEYVGELKSWTVACHPSFYPQRKKNCIAFDFIEIIQDNVLDDLPPKTRLHHPYDLQNDIIRVTRDGIISDNKVPDNRLIHASNLHQRRFINFFNHYFDTSKSYADVQFYEGKREPCPPLNLSYDEMYVQATEDVVDGEKEREARVLLSYLFFYIGRYNVRDQFSFGEIEGERINTERKFRQLFFSAAEVEEEEKEEKEITFEFAPPPLPYKGNK